MNWRWFIGALAAAVALSACTATPDPELECAAGELLCGGGCADTRSDPANCGACGNSCGEGTRCVEGSCAIVCPGGQELCDGACVSLDSTLEHCGACGNACVAGTFCVDGACAAACPEGQTACDGACFDLQASAENCGACGNACDADERCAGGACVQNCGAGSIACDGVCRSASTDEANCGGCGIACGADELCVDGSCRLFCAPGMTECAGACRDTTRDRAHCGTCGNACAPGELCTEGACVLTCDGFASTVCDGACTNTDTDPRNCGGCGIACTAGEVCSEGACAGYCASTLVDCDGGCTSLRDDPAHCGSCGTSCAAVANANPVCTAGGCASVCTAGYGDCDGDLDSSNSNGCETDTMVSVAHCGGCGLACPARPHAAAACLSGSCGVGVCDDGFADCDGAVWNGCEKNLDFDAANCSACGQACAAGQICQYGSCVVPAGESCANPLPITAGLNTLQWHASALDHLVAPPSCGGGAALEGGDVVLRYQAAITGSVGLTLYKPAGARWSAVVSDGTCGSLTNELACLSGSSDRFLAANFDVVAGSAYYVYVADTTDGVAPLDSPLQVAVSELDCTTFAPAALLSPANGAMTTNLRPRLEARFAWPVNPAAGTVQITGNLGTSLSYTLPSPAVTFDSTGREMTITPSAGFRGGEVITVSWSGLTDATCSNAVPAPTWSFTTPASSCAPGQGGMVGTTVTRFPTTIRSSAEKWVAADSDPNGWVYVGGTGFFARTPKTGGVSEDVEVLANLTSNQAGDLMLIDGQDLYTVANAGTRADDLVHRISSDGGATWNVEDLAVFPTVPADAFRGAAVHNGQFYVITQEGTATVDTQIWSFATHAASLPVLAKLEASFGANTYRRCSALAVDDRSFYTLCESQIPPIAYALLRIERGTGAITVVSDGLVGNTTGIGLHGRDNDADGAIDTLYFNASGTEEARWLCAPTAATASGQLVSFGGASGNYGLGYDPVANALWAYDDDTYELVKIQ